jgi:hypothetical protein
MSACDDTIGNITGTDIRVIDYNLSLNLDYYLLPVVLIVCYYVLTISAKEIASKVIYSYYNKWENDWLIVVVNKKKMYTSLKELLI